MKILVVADKPAEYLWGSSVREGLAGIDLILSCGDLDAAYLEYLATFSKAPLLYVHGNHDCCGGRGEPGGCTCIDGRLYLWNGLRILGLGGSVFYNGEGKDQYTQRQMNRRVRKLYLPILVNRGFDILLTHAGAYGVGDQDDPAHVGFRAFNALLDRWKPSWFIHGHAHLNYGCDQSRLSRYGQTQVVNAYERYVIEIDRM